MCCYPSIEIRSGWFGGSVCCSDPMPPVRRASQTRMDYHAHQDDSLTLLHLRLRNIYSKCS